MAPRSPAATSASPTSSIVMTGYIRSGHIRTASMPPGSHACSRWSITCEVIAGHPAVRIATVHAMGQYVALLRAINVGGNNIIRMTDLKSCFEALDFDEVATFIQSGNVLFGAADGLTHSDLTARIESALSRQFGYQARVMLRSDPQLRAVVNNAPDGFGSQPDVYRYDVVFLRDGLSAAEAVQQIPTRQGVDRSWAGDGVCYFSRLISRATQSYLSKIVGLPIYPSVTVRNWNTTVKLKTL